MEQFMLKLLGLLSLKENEKLSLIDTFNSLDEFNRFKLSRYALSEVCVNMSEQELINIIKIKLKKCSN